MEQQMEEKVFFVFFFFPEGRRKSIETLSNKTEHNCLSIF